MSDNYPIGGALRTADFDFELPPEQIAQYPAERRDASRLLVLDRASGRTEHRVFSHVAELLAPGDVLVVNETKVFPARLRGHKTTGAAAEVLLLRPAAEADAGGEALWHALVRPGGKLRAGHRVEIAEGFAVDIVATAANGERLVRLVAEGSVDEAVERYGQVPLPPYVERAADASDLERYQTVYAEARGSVAAPTAGLHFTPELLGEIERKGVQIARLVLHVGVGTFRPVEVDDPTAHPMHSEWYRVSPEAAAVINTARAAGGRVWAVGTTSVRTLETVADEDGAVRAGEGWTDIFIRPPYRFRAVDGIITNFHLPRSTLLMLVAAFAGHAPTMRAYREAVAEGYRFYSFGDAMASI